MSNDLTAGIVRILDQNSATAGTGFVVSEEGLIATCAHVVEAAAAGPGDAVRLVLHATGEERKARIEPNWWRDPNFRAIEGFPIGTLSLLCTVIDPVPGDVADHARTIARADPQARHLSGTPDDRDVELLLPAPLS